MRESRAFDCVPLRTIGLVVAVAMGTIVMHANAQTADSSAAASPFHIAAQARGPLHELWEHSMSAKQERVACLGGHIDHDAVYITRVELLAPTRADSANISARASLRECSAPTWLGTVHTHIATFRGLPYTIFSAPDRYVMMLWREKWKSPGVFCILYSDVDATCELGNTVSGHVQYEYAKSQSIGS